MMQACDILIIGAGPAGLSAALAAAPSGASIVIVDDNLAPGGQIWRDGPGVQLPRAARRLRDAVAACSNVRIRSATRVVAAPAAQTLLLEDADHAVCMVWKKLVLCLGARELLLPFPGWTLPGVTGAGGLQALVKAGMAVAGERTVVAGSGPLLLAAAATARQAGAQVLLVAEQARWTAVAGFAAQLWRWPGKALQAVALASPRYATSTHIVAVQGQGRVESVRLRQGGRTWEVACDRVACGFGLVPNVQLGQLLGCALALDASGVQSIAVDTWQATSLPNVYAAGECTGFGGSERALAQGRIAGYAAVGNTVAAQQHAPERARWDGFARQLQRSFALDPQLQQLPAADTLVCRCEDVRWEQLAAFSSWTEAKLHSRCGMGACQGRVCGAATQFLLGWTPPAPRGPLVPARIGTLAAYATGSTTYGE
jgi:NADPH-dependent 2,4-dienoyl-CoA reductase/sulfur reductase-like enzyme